MLVPFVGEAAFANSFVNSSATSHQLVSQQTRLPQTQSSQTQLAQIPLGVVSNQAKVLSSLVEPSTPVAFSDSHDLASASQQPSATVNADYSWSLSYATQANTTQVNSAVQSVVAKVASDTARAKACVTDSCRRLTYIRSQLPIAAARVGRLEEQLKDFSRQHGQGDISAYKKALADRITEVASQERQLDIELDQTRLRAEQLKTQLSFADVEVDIAEQILAEDAIYQALWVQLSTVEENIQTEYSRVNADGTALNQLYAEYQALLGKTHVAAGEALNRYLLAGGSQTLGTTYFTEAATEAFSALLVETHQQKVQQLRQRKLAALETSLIGRQQRLSRNIGEYERLQRELLSQQSVLDSYQSERDLILATSPEAALAVSGIPTHHAQLVAGQSLLPLLPNGSVAKTLLGIALAASTVAAASHRRAEKKAALLGKRILEIFPTSHAANRPANRPLGKGHSSRPTKGYSADPVKSQPQIISLSNLGSKAQVKKSAAENLETADAKGIEIVESAGSFEVMFAAEETPKQPDSFCVVNDLGEFEISESTVPPLSKIAPEIEVDDFNQALENLTSENHLTHEIDNHDIAPVRLPVADTDLFLDQVIDWISEDLGLAAPVAASGESDQAKTVANSAVDSVVTDPVVADPVVADSVVADSVVADPVVVNPMTPSATANSPATSIVTKAIIA
ncbi:hypothetical protein [Synechococcus sp. PCC 7335]|uniref:hypothetical protein n=1 Tax=Synechococcus sp. (strain ATCC 29403 / PCC 7335) TaxID=91464 RepID=UPI0002E051EA|nr:hypothetical protein [Synechococcus sp. PCC 7335]